MPGQLRITAADGLTQVVAFTSNLTLGRSLEAGLSFPEERGLSRTHVAFEIEDGREWVRDLGSLNGTFVNGERLTGRRELRPGDAVTIAGLSVVFARGDDNPAPAVTFEQQAESGFRGAEQVINLQTILHRSAKTTGAGEALDSRRMVAEALLRVGRELARNQPLEELFRTILQVAIRTVGAERGVVVTLLDGEPAVQAHEGGEIRISSGVRNRVLKEKVSLIIRDVQVDPSWDSRQSLVAQGVLSVMAVPLQTDEKVIGMLYLDSSGASGGRRFDVQDLELITVMANVAAIRIERERLVEVQRAGELLNAELRRAEEIQRQCLPERPPHVEGVDLAASTQPCYTVGGDYYDFVPRQDGRLAVVVADVAGKGLSAALLMMNLQARVQVLAADLDDPAAIVRRLNEMLLPICPAGRFVTLVFGIYNPATGELRYTNAGHEPPLLMRRAGGVELLEQGGPVVGMLPDLAYETGVCTLAPGDALVLFSDGLSEARGPGGEELGPERIAEAFRAAGEVAASVRLRALGGRVAEWLGGSSFHDDMTVVALIRR